ncbi:hypothetical protein GLAREA_02553 [Glarea lozoyensis ATCC 20868]|uniref:Uncharacterized protein n=1 Tax=Glarea lozoyensis (strain ATCC 20868 / MF5171) TaxID=1116229 RepID=S3CLM6_GLAL2|nr:uncharacterized protein GLAREA_02553 [Glarea lozoyensis ATCC 20868]EPE26640.1 hypothetical protein GLAREA_02553 [Glarea lozoyensis ATCC 20868]
MPPPGDIAQKARRRAADSSLKQCHCATAPRREDAHLGLRASRIISIALELQALQTPAPDFSSPLIASLRMDSAWPMTPVALPDGPHSYPLRRSNALETRAR